MSICQFCLRPQSYIPAVGPTSEAAPAAEATPEATVWDAGDERKYEVNRIFEKKEIIEKKFLYQKKNCTIFFVYILNLIIKINSNYIPN